MADVDEDGDCGVARELLTTFAMDGRVIGEGISRRLVLWQTLVSNFVDGDKDGCTFSLALAGQGSMCHATVPVDGIRVSSMLTGWILDGIDYFGQPDRRSVAD